MSDGYKFSNITDNQLRQLGVQALADRPNAAQRYGESGLSAQQLKLWFDNLATLLAGRLNELQTALTSEDATKYIGLALGEYKTLGDLIDAMQDGRFAAEVLKVYPYTTSEQRVSLQGVIDDMAYQISNNYGYISGVAGDVEQLSIRFAEIEKGKFVTRIATDNSNVVYVELTGDRGTLGYKLANAATAWSIPERDKNGNICVGITPTADNSAASKKYVDDTFGAFLSDIDDLLGGG